MQNKLIQTARSAWARLTPRPKQLPEGRWLADFGQLSAAEARLITYSRIGKRWEPAAWNEKRPTEETDENRIRADLIRFLALGGDKQHPVHEEGLLISGAWIVGELNLHQCKDVRNLSLKDCHFVHDINLIAARLPELTLSGSLLQRLRADGLVVTGDVYLRAGFDAKAGVRFLGARIGGDLTCTDGSFSSPKYADKDRNVPAIQAQRLELNGVLFLKAANVTGSIDLRGAKVRTLRDDAQCWTAGGYFLNGFRYDNIEGSVKADERIQWLQGQQQDQLKQDKFAPHPWEQLAHVLREMGHTGEAAEVAIAKQDAMRAANRIGQRHPKRFADKRVPKLRRWIDKKWVPISNALSRTFHLFYGLSSGYGYRPQRIAYLLTALIAFSSLVFWWGDTKGFMGPTSDLMVLVERNSNCGSGGEPRSVHWTDPHCRVPPEYSTFNPFVYAIDVTLPLVDLDQQSEWAPIVMTRSGEVMLFGCLLRILMWANILFGWVGSLMFIAVVSRLVEKD